MAENSTTNARRAARKPAAAAKSNATCPVCKRPWAQHVPATPTLLGKDDEWLALSEVGRQLGLKDWHDVRNLIHSGKLEGRKFDTGRIRVAASAVAAYIEAHSRPIGQPL